MNTEKIKKGFSYIPEILILLVAIYWFLDNLLGASHVNYVMIGIIMFISILIILKNKIMALFTSLIIGLGSFYMIFAVLSEYREFSAGNADGFKLLLIGTSLFIITLLMAIILPVKYICQR